MSARQAAALVGLLWLAFGLRIAVIYALDPTPLVGDELGYFNAARKFAHPGGAAWMPDPGAPLTFGRPPLILLYFGGLVRLFGPSVWALRLADGLVGSLAVLPTYALGRRMGGPLCGALAALGVAVQPDLLSYSATLWSEPLYIALLFGALALLTWEGPRWSAAAAAAGAAMGACALTREVGLSLPLLGLAYAAMARPPGTRRGLALAAAAFLGLVLPWTARINRAPGPPRLVSDVATWNLYQGNTDGQPPYKELADTEPERAAIARQRVARTRGWS